MLRDILVMVVGVVVLVTGCIVIDIVVLLMLTEANVTYRDKGHWAEVTCWLRRVKGPPEEDKVAKETPIEGCHCHLHQLLHPLALPHGSSHGLCLSKR